MVPKDVARSGVLGLVTFDKGIMDKLECGMYCTVKACPTLNSVLRYFLNWRE